MGQSTKDENLQEDLRKCRERYEEARDMVLSLRKERDSLGFDDIKKFMSLTDEINTWSVRRETAREDMAKIRNLYSPERIKHAY